MGIFVLFAFLFGFGISIVAMTRTTINQRKLRKEGKGCSWGKFLAIAFVLTIPFVWYGASSWPSDLSAEFNAWMWSTFLISVAPGLGFLLADAYCSR